MALIVATVTLLITPEFVFAQEAIENPVEWGSIIQSLPGWVELVLTVIVVFILPLAQFLLKRIPTEESVKIQGWLGKILDLLTFFQKDKSTGGGVHPKK